MKLGIVTHQIAKDWDDPTIIKHCGEIGYAGVELRTSHAHGVEVSLTPEERREVKKQFADAGTNRLGGARMRTGGGRSRRISPSTTRKHAKLKGN